MSLLRVAVVVGLLVTVTLLFEISQAAADVNQTSCKMSKVSEQDVLAYLDEKNPKYSPNARPRRNSSESVRVTVSLSLFGIKDFLEQEGTLLLSGAFTVNWTDDYMRWDDVFPLKCVSFVLIVENNGIWRPSFRMTTNSIDNMRSQMQTSPLELYSDGSIRTFPQGVMSTDCDIDVAMFPFDSQLCTVMIDSWNYNISEMSVAAGNLFIKKEEFYWTRNRQWQIASNYSESLQYRFADDGEYYSRISFKLYLQRKPLYYYVNVIIPSIIISVVELVTFTLEGTEVAKLTISLTCLLAYTVFQGVINGDMPRSGRHLPLLSFYIDLQMAYIGCIAILGSGVVFLISSWANQEPPPCWLYQTMRSLGRAFCVRNRSSDDPKYPASQRWIFIANVIDRLSLLLYVSASTLTPIIFFAIFPKQRSQL